MNRKVNAPVVIVVILLLVGALYGIFQIMGKEKPIEHPGASDIPPKQATDNVNVPLPKDVGKIPGKMDR